MFGDAHYRFGLLKSPRHLTFCYFSACRYHPNVTLLCTYEEKLSEAYYSSGKSEVLMGFSNFSWHRKGIREFSDTLQLNDVYLDNVYLR